MAFSAIPIYWDWAFPMNGFWIFWLNGLGPHGAGDHMGPVIIGWRSFGYHSESNDFMESMESLDSMESVEFIVSMEFIGFH